MEEKNKLPRMVFTLAAAIFAAVILVIGGTFFLISRNTGSRQEIIRREPEKALQAVITANPGGAAPTPIPSQTPEPAIGMESPLICKMELAGLNHKASECGISGMLTLNRYDFGTGTCFFDIKNMSAPGDHGQIEAIRDPQTGDYGITLRIDRAREDVLMKWGKAALLYFNSGITAEDAKGSIEKVLREGAADSDLYSLSVHDDMVFRDNKAESIRVLEITTAQSTAEN